MASKFAVCRAMKFYGYCNNIFPVKGINEPVIYVCPKCEEEINKGIKQQVHLYTGKTRGNINERRT